MLIGNIENSNRNSERVGIFPRLYAKGYKLWIGAASIFSKGNAGGDSGREQGGG